jgi:hypothetical protein
VSGGLWWCVLRAHAGNQLIVPQEDALVAARELKNHALISAWYFSAGSECGIPSCSSRATGQRRRPAGQMASTSGQIAFGRVQGPNKVCQPFLWNMEIHFQVFSRKTSHRNAHVKISGFCMLSFGRYNLYFFSGLGISRKVWAQCGAQVMLYVQQWRMIRLSQPCQLR